MRNLWLLLGLSACGEIVYVGDEAASAPGELSLSPAALDFDIVPLHAEAREALTLTNTGAGPLRVYDVALSDDRVRPHWTLRGGRSGVLAQARRWSWRSCCAPSI